MKKLRLFLLATAFTVHGCAISGASFERTEDGEWATTVKVRPSGK